MMLSPVGAAVVSTVMGFLGLVAWNAGVVVVGGGWHTVGP